MEEKSGDRRGGVLRIVHCESDPAAALAPALVVERWSGRLLETGPSSGPSKRPAGTENIVPRTGLLLLS